MFSLHKLNISILDFQSISSLEKEVSSLKKEKISLFWNKFNLDKKNYNYPLLSASF